MLTLILEAHKKSCRLCVCVTWYLLSHMNLLLCKICNGILEYAMIFITSAIKIDHNLRVEE